MDIRQNMLFLLIYWWPFEMRSALQLISFCDYIGRRNQSDTPLREGVMTFCIQTKMQSKTVNTNTKTFPHILKLKWMFLPSSHCGSLSHISSAPSFGWIEPSWHDKNGKLLQLYVRKISKYNKQLSPIKVNIDKHENQTAFHL